MFSLTSTLLSANPLIEGLEDAYHPVKWDGDKEMVFGKASQSSRPKVEERQPYLTRDRWVGDPSPASRARKLGLYGATFPVAREAYETVERAGLANEHHDVR